MWDFETDPEFQEKLDWMRRFVDENLVPLEPIQAELPADEWKLETAYCSSRSRTRACGERSSTPNSADPVSVS